IPLGLSLCACLLIPVVGFFAFFWAEGKPAPLRVVDVVYFYFIIGMAYFSFSLITYVKKRRPKFSFPLYVKIPLYGMLIFILVSRTNTPKIRLDNDGRGINYNDVVLFVTNTNNITAAYTDVFSGKAAAYSKEMEARHEFLKNSKGDTCMIDTIQNIPRTIAYYDQDRSVYVIDLMTWFYNKKYIGVKGRKGPLVPLDQQ
ncbi:MAG TPA: hypothetical protein VN922_22540, partial [Bacteroidia bacterium]|nr:hypothetical protein [Bacteroidia bacterium]